MESKNLSSKKISEKTIYVSKSEYAQHRGVSPAAITKHIKNGVIALNDEGQVDLEFSDQLLNAYTKSRLKPNKIRKYEQKEEGPPPYTSPPTLGAHDYDNLEDSYLKARADLTRHKADQAKLELQEAEKTLVKVDSVDMESFSCARRTRDAIMSVPDRVGAIIASETSVLEVKRILKEELTKSLEEVLLILEGEEDAG